MEKVNTCPVCNSASATPAFTVADFFFTKESFTLVDCSQCGFRFTNPRPSQSEVGRYYHSDGYLSHRTTNKGITASIYRILRQYALGAKLSIVRRFSSADPLLDIGCGTGSFLRYAQAQGFSVSGVEPGEAARNEALRLCGPNISKRLDELPTNTSSFSAITLWHVLEHLDNLGDYLARVKSLLSPEGRVFIAVPNRSSWDCDYYGPFWAAWDVPRHFWHFRNQDISRLLENHGFKLEETRNMWLDAYFISLLSEKYKGRAPWFAWPLAAIRGTYSNLLAVLKLRPTSSTLFIARLDNNPA